MRTAWVCFWLALGAVEVGLALWTHASIFLEIGAVASLMIAYNLLGNRIGATPTARIPVKVT